MALYVKKIPGGGEKVVELNEADLRLQGDFLKDADSIAGRVGLVGELLGEYVERFAVADAEYRHWRGERTVAIKAEDGKAAQWMVDRMIEADPEFMVHKSTLATLEGQVEAIRRHYEAMRLKADLMRTVASREGSTRYVESVMTITDEGTPPSDDDDGFLAPENSSDPLVSSDRFVDIDNDIVTVSSSEKTSSSDKFRAFMETVKHRPGTKTKDVE